MSIPISTITDLQEIGNIPACPLNGSYHFTQNINAWDTETWDEGAGFDSIQVNFSGTLDGRGFALDGLHQKNRTYSGLFATLSGTLRNLRITNANFEHNSQNAGIVAGRFSGRIENCSIQGTMVATEMYHHGGVVGRGNIDSSGSMENVICDVDVTGLGATGGINGMPYANETYTNCLVVGPVSGNNAATFGAIFGNTAHWTGTTTDCYWDEEATGVDRASGTNYTDPVGCTGLNSYESRQLDSYTGFNFTTKWHYEPGLYPILRAFPLPVPQYIRTLDDLQNISDMTGWYRLARDIAASPSGTWHGGAGWLPLDNFEGVFDGNGFVVRELHCNRPARPAVGLFGTVRKNAVILRLGLENPTMDGDYYCGGLVGVTYDTTLIYECHVLGGTVAGQNTGGRHAGFVGNARDRTTIADSYSFVDLVTSAGYGANFIGVVQHNTCQLIRCWSAGDATSALAGEGNVRRFVANHSGIYDNCYTDNAYCDIDHDHVGNLATEEMQQQATFLDWDFEEVWSIDEGYSYPSLLIFIKPFYIAQMYTLEVRDSSGSMVSPLPNWYGGVVDEEIDRSVSARFNVPYDEELNGAFIPRNEVWIRDDRGDLLYQLPIFDVNDKGGTNHYTELVCFDRMSLLNFYRIDELIIDDSPETIPSILESILVFAEDFHLERVEDTNDLELRFESRDESVLTSLKRIQEHIGGYYWIDEDWGLNWSDHVDDEGQQLRIGKNIKGIERNYDYSLLINRLWLRGAGTGEDRVVPTKAEYVATSRAHSTNYPGAYLAFRDDLVPSSIPPGALNASVWKIEFLDGNEEGEIYGIEEAGTDDSWSGNLYDWFLLDDLVSIAKGDRFIVYKVSEYLVDYVEDSTSIESYGLHENTLIDQRVHCSGELMSIGMKKLAEHKDPIVNYRVEAVDLSRLLDVDFSFEYWKIGSNIRIIDEFLGIDTKANLVKIVRDLDNPLQSTLEIATHKPSLSDHLDSIEDRIRKLQSNDPLRNAVSPGGSIPRLVNDVLDAFEDDLLPDIVDEIIEEGEYFSAEDIPGPATVIPSRIALEGAGGVSDDKYAREDHVHPGADRYVVYNKTAMNNLTGIETGDFCYTTQTGRLYVRAGSNWVCLTHLDSI